MTVSSTAEVHRVGLHVDNCLGGFLLSYLAKIGRFEQLWVGVALLL